MSGNRGFGRGQHPEELLSASLADDLTTAERAALDAHLAGCEQCRVTLSAWGEERRLISGLREVPPPRDLGARVRVGIEGRGLSSVPWWRRPATLVGAFAAVATVAAAVMAVVVLGNLNRGPIGATNEPSATTSLGSSPTVEPSGSPPSSVAPSAPPTVEPIVALEPGELGYLSLHGQPFSPERLYFVNDENGESVQATTPSGPPIAAALSPTGEWLAYITEIGQSGWNQVWLLHLTDGTAQVLGCSLPNPFMDRLVWSDDGHWLAYTLSSGGPGGGVECGGVEGDGSATDVWVFDAAATGGAFQLTDEGNAFAADFAPSSEEYGEDPVLLSYAAAQPYTRAISFVTDRTSPPVDGVFMPLLSPDGTRALFWRGHMASDDSVAWRFDQGGMAYLSGEPVDGQPSWSGEPLFVDLEQPGGAGFESAHFGWADDGDLLAFWDGQWTGAPQDDAGAYPSSTALYVGRISEGLLSEASVLEFGAAEDGRITSVAFDPDANELVVSVGLPSAGIGDPPSAQLIVVPLDGGEPRPVGGAANPEPWLGPAVFGAEAIPAQR